MTEKQERSEEQQQAMFPGGPSVASLHETDLLASLSAFARAFGTDRETLRNCIVENEIQPAGERAGHKLWALRHVYQAWTATPEEQDPDKLSPFKRRAWYQGEREKLALQVSRGELVDALEVERTLGRLMQVLARGLETVLDVIERDCGLSPSQASAGEKHIDEIREELYRELTAVDDETDPDTPAVGASEETPAVPRKAPPASEASNAVEIAIAFLKHELADGPKGTKAILEAGKASGLSESTMRRARKTLGDRITAKREGRGWVWVLS